MGRVVCPYCGSELIRIVHHPPDSEPHINYYCSQCRTQFLTGKVKRLVLDLVPAREARLLLRMGKTRAGRGVIKLKLKGDVVFNQSYAIFAENSIIIRRGRRLYYALVGGEEYVVAFSARHYLIPKTSPPYPLNFLTVPPPRRG